MEMRVEWRGGRNGEEGGMESREEWRVGRNGEKGGMERREEWRGGNGKVRGKERETGEVVSTHIRGTSMMKQNSQSTRQSTGSPLWG